MELPEPKNVGSWRLNKKEVEELQSRVKAGEDEATAKREIQLRKARACEDRKQSAAAVVSKTTAQLNPKPKSSAKAKAVPEPPAGDSGPNKAYYMEVQEDLATVLSEFPGLDKEMPLGISAGNSGVQEPYDMGKCKLAIEARGVYRCSVTITWLAVFSSPTPGIPMSSRRVTDLVEFMYPGFEPKFLTSRNVEVAVTDKQIQSTAPQNLQMLSPEELCHAMLRGCAGAVKSLGHLNFFAKKTLERPFRRMQFW